MKARLESTNFLTNVVILIFMGLAATGITTTLDPNQTVTSLMAKDMTFIVQIFIPALITLGAKIWSNVQAKTFSFKAMIKSPNFITQAITVLAGILAFIPIILPETAPVELSNAFFSGSVIVLIGAIIANIVNPVWHFISDWIKKKKEEKTLPAPVPPTR
jgi:hypothetical protein